MWLKKISFWLWLGLLCEIAIAIYLTGRVHSLRGNLTEVSREVAQVSELKVAIAEAEAAVKKQGLSDVGRPPSVRTGSFNIKLPSKKEMEAQRLAKLISESAAARNLDTLNQRFLVSVRYGGLLSRLGLDPAKSDQLLTLLVDKMLAGSDINKSIETQISKLSPMEMVEMQKLIPEAKREIEKNIQQLLGDVDFEKYKYFDDNLAPNLLAVEMQQILSKNDSYAMMTQSQMDELVRILIENTPTRDSKSVALVPLASGSAAEIVVGNSNFRVLAQNDIFVDRQGNIESNFWVSDAALKASSQVLRSNQLAVLQAIRQRTLAERMAATRFHLNTSNN